MASIKADLVDDALYNSLFEEAADSVYYAVSQTGYRIHCACRCHAFERIYNAKATTNNPVSCGFS